MNSVRQCSVLLVVLGFAIAAGYRVVKYKYFDEYLIHLEKTEKSILIEEIEVVKMVDPLPFRSGYKHSKDEKCCMLGNLAGQKGFHCAARFYASRILHRNYNRAHNKRIAALLGGRPDPATDKLMKTFERCVAHRGSIFHKCCRYVALNSV